MTAAAGGKQDGTSGLIVALAILTLLGVAAGALVGKLVAGRLHAAPQQQIAPLSESARLPYAGDTEVRELEPIITDLAGGHPVRVRLQLSIVFSKKAVTSVPTLAALVSDDILAFVRTLTLEQLQGASGLQNLREDLNERANIRSQGAVREVIIETLVTQ